MTLLDVRGLSKRFAIHQLGREVVAFTDVHFTLHPGEFLLLRGHNGVGKSTLLRCLYRSYLPTSGEAYYRSENGPIDLVRAADVDIIYLRKHEIGHVTQFLRPRPRISALDLVAEPLLLDGATHDEAYAAGRYWLQAFGLKAEIWGAYPTTFSGGEQQKVNLVRALIQPRRLLLLDEPTAALDSDARAALVARLRELKDAGVAMIGVFHHPEDVLPLVDNQLMLTADDTLEMAEKELADVAR